MKAEKDGIDYDAFESYKTIKLLDIPEFRNTGNTYFFKKDDPSRLIFVDRVLIFEFCIETLSIVPRYKFNSPM